MIQAKFYTYLLILIPFAFSPLYVFATYYYNKASIKKSMTLGGIVFFWALTMFLISYFNLVDFLGSFKAFFVIANILIPILIVYRFRNWLVADLHSQRFLIGFQIFRAIGILFIFEMYSGYLPAIFSFPAGIGDVIVGCIAFFLSIISFYVEPIPRYAIVTLAILGIVDFVSAVFFGITSSSGPLQLFSSNLPNPILLYPTSLIPLFGIPLAACYHILSLALLKKENRRV